RIGDTRLRFLIDLADADTEERAKMTAALPVPPLPPPLADVSRTDFQTDALTALCSFMGASVAEMSPRDLILRALRTVHTQTGASVSGFLSLDRDDPLPKIVLPDLTHVDIHLSRKLTQRVQDLGHSVWLGADPDAAHESESLLSFGDAVCVPLQVHDLRLG